MSSFRSALVTGGRSGIGAAVVAALEDEGTAVRVLDIADGFDVADPDAWQEVGAVEAACLNAGVVTAESDIVALSHKEYRRVLGVNLDGVVFGVRRLAQVMEPGSAIAVTASLAGLVGAAEDPIYTLTKHGVVGFVRSVAPQLEERGIRINAICPGFVDTPLVSEEARAAIDVPLIEPSFVAEAALQALQSEDTGQAWVVQPNRIERFRFPGVPGPREAVG